MKNKSKSIRLPNAIIETLQAISKKTGFPKTSLVRKSINAALRNRVVWTNHQVTTTSDDSDTVRCALMPQQYELPGKVIAAYVNWFLQKEGNAILNHKPFVPEGQGDYIIKEVN